MASLIGAAASQGIADANAIEEQYQRRKALGAAIDQYGDVARDPGLFSSLQNIEASKGRETRAQNAETRTQGTYDFNKQGAEQERQQKAVLGMMQGFKAARDNGEDIGATFDKFEQTGLFDSLGVNPEDRPAMKQAIVENPALIDTYIATLAGGTAPAKTSAATKTAATPAATGEADRQAARENVSRTIGKMRDLYTTLDELGAIRSTETGSIRESLGRAASASKAGRVTGAVFGTKAESARRSIEGLRPNLINAMKSAEELGAKMFDSNKDMEMWLATVTDPSQDLQTAKLLLDEFEAKYGAALRGEAVSPIKVGDQAEYTRKNDTGGVTEIYPGFVNPNTKMRFKGGQWDDPANWEKAE